MSKANANTQAKKIVNRPYSAFSKLKPAIENSVSVFHIDNDEVKGRIIGREGRNIRALRPLQVREIVVDDTPKLSLSRPLNPSAAKSPSALHQLESNGRSHTRHASRRLWQRRRSNSKTK